MDFRALSSAKAQEYASILYKEGGMGTAGNEQSVTFHTHKNA